MPPAILAPAAGALDAAICEDGIPVAIGLLLILGDDHEADRLVRREIRTAIQPDKAAPENGELDRQLAARLAAGDVAGRRIHPIDMAVRKGGGVELCRLPRLAMIEPEAGDKIGHIGAP